MKTPRLLILCLACLMAVAAAGRDVYLFSYFRGEKDGLHLAYSYDGLTWKALNGNQSLLKPQVGQDRLMRDPSIVQGPDGTFHMVWTSSWHDRIIGYASSRDLIHWSPQRAIPVMDQEPEAQNCWAPELFYDEPSQTYYILWATTITGGPGQADKDRGDKDGGHRIYCTTTRDFQTFSPTRLYFDPGFSVIDAAIVRPPRGKDLLMLLKNENSKPAEKNLRTTRTRDIRKGFSTRVSAPITGKYWAEGPAPLYVGDTLYVYFDKYMEGRYGAVRSTDDGRTWTDVSDQVSFPQGIRHGTAFRVDESLLNSLRVATGDVPQVTWDAQGLMMDGRYVLPAMGEIHYSRVAAADWPAEIRKMKEGGIGIAACYVFWIHHEEEEGIFDWSGNRDLRRFLEICKEEGMPVVLRMGPFCHGECRNGGLPDWLFGKDCGVRDEGRAFQQAVARFYRQLYAQVQGLQWKDGGPLVGAQFDNEFGGPASYLLSLKRMALQAGFDLPFYTRTGWPPLSTPMPAGEMLPLYGDYADGFWNRELTEGVAMYHTGFNFKETRASADIASEQFKQNFIDEERTYPYFTCELGGGMMTSYNRRIYIHPEDVYSMALVKLGSGSNMLGYYMYHGGTHPDGRLTTMNENQHTLYVNYNELPVKTYDFQAPLGEFGQRRPHYYMLRLLHLFLQDFGERLTGMKAHFPAKQLLERCEDGELRWAYRTDGEQGFIFVNNYERYCELTPKEVSLEVAGVKLPRLTIPSGTACIFPVNIDEIRYATAQIIARRGGKLYMQEIPGIPTEIAFKDGRVLRRLKPLGPERPVAEGIYLLTPEQAGHLFLPTGDSEPADTVRLDFRQERKAGTPRQIPMGKHGVAEQPTDADFEQAAVYSIQLPAEHTGLLNIDYRGDVARLYADGRLVCDNFYNGRPFQFGLWQLPAECRQLELRILPLQDKMPVYFPREAGTIQPGEAVRSVSLLEAVRLPFHRFSP